MRHAILRDLFPQEPPPKPPSQSDPNAPLHPYAMYVVPDDPLRDTAEKAQVYYEKVKRILESRPDASKEDVLAAAKMLMKVPGAVANPYIVGVDPAVGFDQTVKALIQKKLEDSLKKDRVQTAAYTYGQGEAKPFA